MTDLEEIKYLLAKQEAKTPRLGGVDALRRLVIFLIIAGFIGLAVYYGHPPR
jgi:hypothetical protein